MEGDEATPFAYWVVTQADGDRSVIGWGTYGWTLRRAGRAWPATELRITILTMTPLDRGGAVPGPVMMPFTRRRAGPR